MEKQDNNRLKISEIPIPTTSCIIKTFISDKDRIEILNFIEKQQENKLFFMNDNLIDIERTDWFYHEDKEFKPYYNKILSELNDAMFYFTLKKNNSDEIDDLNIKLWMKNCWYGKSGKNAFVKPHCHGIGYFAFSFSCYLNIPSKESSLEFYSNDNRWSEKIVVREGDILVFPSNLLHYTRDLEENRSILSGNFLLESMYVCNCDECKRKLKNNETNN